KYSLYRLFSKSRVSNSQYETDFGISSAEGAGNAKIGFLKARQRRVFKKPILAFPAPKALEMPKSVSY
ncbi:MAG: hypothetical protein RLZZ139_3213, partial [Cyanobacteriota bacterium]